MYKPNYNKQKLLLERMVDMFKHCTASLEPTSQNSNAFETQMRYVVIKHWEPL